MLNAFRRLAAVALLVSLAAPQLSACAGWQASPEARMACCEDESTCPMHKAGTLRTGDHSQVTQAQADDCCSAAEQRGSSAPTAPARAAAHIVDVALAPPTSLFPVVSSLRPFGLRRPADPPAPRSVPTHLLLAVFLV